MHFMILSKNKSSMPLYELGSMVGGLVSLVQLIPFMLKNMEHEDVK